jgi:hypothetical protein
MSYFSETATIKLKPVPVMAENCRNVQHGSHISEKKYNI